MLIVAGSAVVNPDQIAELTALGETMMKASRAEAGCRDYVFSIEVGAPSKLRIFEMWTDQAALDSHFQEPHMAAFQEGLAKLEVQDVKATIYEIAEERVLVG